MYHARVAIFNDTHGWHSDQLTEALSALGMEAVLIDLADCRIDTRSSTGMVIPKFENALPDAVLVRGIAPGSLEQITLRMDVLHTLAELGVPVLNPAHAIELTVDKARTSLKLHLANIPSPHTWACENRQQALQIAREEFAKGFSLVVKPLFGCQGKGIQRIDDLSQLDKLAVVGEAYYLQHYIAPAQADSWQDWRLMVVQGEVIAAMTRRSNHWITNFAQGASCFASTVTNEMMQLAIQATSAVEAPYAGVDLIQDQQGHFSVLEVNSVPAWKGLYQATGVDVASRLALMVTSHIQQSRQVSLPEHAG
ncbi:RimK family alpha-L-glutamate ligase [Methylophaga pinxianii]|uniref:RimK family alpha-L-glutamate ligase n=1 Tax=Methylophaga pinxianii TaxID=2881052 RepID=UPI001CF15E37|nr:RimK family alpha-L-glutamate ligase [Methylophaga pinxianii]MCB2427737.1 RimK family alpha-L-glutamate ligase [Methylophaga pinxianii]UPH46236.1 RimK family alpha-L-glutamate ligase [Methylophaga pinxianii]